jgi:hypothetical protein
MRFQLGIYSVPENKHAVKGQIPQYGLTNQLYLERVTL